MLNPLLNSSFIRAAFEIAKTYYQDIFLVGGAVRDFLIHSSLSKDLDFTLGSNVKSIARTFSDTFKGTFFCLDQEREYYRIIITHNAIHQTVDFSPIFNGDINSDLMNRDFSINSIAIRLGDLFEEKTLAFIDPAGGLNDVKKRCLKASSLTSFSNDPVRILRAVRFSLKYNFAIDPHTLTLLLDVKNRLPGCCWERIRNELFNIFNQPAVLRSLRELDKLGLLTLLIPEIEIFKGLEQGVHHGYDLWEHSLRTSHFTETVLQNIKYYIPQHEDSLENYFNEQLETEIERGSLLKFTALIHDAGKPLTKINEGNQTSFHRHDRLGMLINKDIAKRFKLGKKATRIIISSTQHHMRLLNLSHLNNLSVRVKYRFFKDLDPASLDTIILFIADMMATREHSPENKTKMPILNLASDLIDYYFQEFSKERVTPLLNGNEIMEVLGLKPGRRVGELLSLIRKAESEGAISTREEAIKLISACGRNTKESS